LRYIRHHLLDNYDDVTSYDGPVRQITLKNLSPPASQRKPAFGSWLRTSSSGSLFQMNADQSRQSNHSGSSPPLFGLVKTKTTSHTAPQSDDLDTKSAQSNGTTSGGSGESGGYSTALSVTIAVGCSLLILNVLVFAGVYYQL